MKKAYIFFAVAFVLFTAATSAQDSNTISGTWVGSINLGTIELRIVLNVNDTTGKLVTLLDSPDQGVKDIPTDSTTLLANKFAVYATLLKAKYEGDLQPGDSLINGKWFQAGQSWDLILHKRHSSFTLKRLQEPKPPFPYKVEEVTFKNNKAGISLAGTLTIPEGEGPFPAVVLITGSGPQNRDEEIMGHKPFWVIADYLTRHGIEVLRYDDRGIGKSEGKFNIATTYDFADDAEAAFNWLFSRPETDKSKVGLVGHSEGGMIAPVIASRNKNVGFIILLAGPGEPGLKILEDQTKLIMQKSGSSKKEIKQTTSLNDKLFDIVIHEPDSAKANQKLIAAITDGINRSKSISDSIKETTITQTLARIGQLLTPWFRTFLLFDPKPYLEKTTCPVLALNGSNDLQVPCAENLEGIAKALKKGGNTKYETVQLEGLNHLFQHSETGLPTEYGKIEETFAPEALQIMDSWINKLK